MGKIKKPGNVRTKVEKEVVKRFADVFQRCPDSTEVKLDHFSKYIRRQSMAKMLSLYEIFKKILHIKGSIVECGVFRGFSLMAWANMSSILEPYNFSRRIYGFDTFKGFPAINKKDISEVAKPSVGQLSSTSSYKELLEIIDIYDSNRFLGHIDKVQLIKGDIAKTVPKFIKKNKHLVVGLLYIDLDLYEPTKVAIEHFYPRMTKGSILALDEIDNPNWPGETMAVLETLGINKFKFQRVTFDPHTAFAVIE